MRKEVNDDCVKFFFDENEKYEMQEIVDIAKEDLDADKLSVIVSADIVTHKTTITVKSLDDEADTDTILTGKYFSMSEASPPKRFAL